MSDRTVASSPSISSGARYSGVPVNRPLGAAPAACTYCPAPKSISTRRPPSSRITFCALMSRCTRPALWTDASARHNSWPISAASRAPNDPVADTRQDSPFVKDLFGEFGRLPSLAQQLQGYVAVQACVARPVHVAERSLADLLDEFE